MFSGGCGGEGESSEIEATLARQAGMAGVTVETGLGWGRSRENERASESRSVTALESRASSSVTHLAETWKAKCAHSLTKAP